jgi:hypothetical protein
MKDQESLGFVALKNGWKLESDNELLQKLNKGNKNKTVLQYLKENQEQFNVYNQ